MANPTQSIGPHGVVPAFPMDISSSAAQAQPRVIMQRDTIAMQGLVRGDPHVLVRGDPHGIQTPTKEILWNENQALQSHLSWTQQAAHQEIHSTKEAAARKLENALTSYKNEFRDACELYEDSLHATQAQEVSTYAAISKAAQTQAAATQMNANLAMQRAELEMNVVRQKEMTAQQDLFTTEQHLAQSRSYITKVTSEGQAQTKSLYQSQAQAQDVADNASAHLEQLRYKSRLLLDSARCR
jgi:hypothetical protein